MEWEWIHRISLGQQSQVSQGFKDQLTSACKHLLTKMGEHWVEEQQMSNYIKRRPSYLLVQMFGNGAKIITTLCPKTENRVIFNILYCSCKSFAMKFSVWYPDDIKRVHNLLPHLTYVFTLPDITQKLKSYVVFLSIAWVALKRTSLGVSEVAVIRAGRVAGSHKVFEVTSVCYHIMNAAVFATVWSMASSMMPWGISSNMAPFCRWAPASARQCRVSVFV